MQLFYIFICIYFLFSPCYSSTYETIWILGKNVNREYSTLINDIKGLWYNVVTYDSKSDIPRLITDDLASNVNKIIILGVSELPNAWPVTDIVDWVDMGGSFILALGESISSLSGGKHSLITLFEQFGMKLHTNTIRDPLQDYNHDASEFHVTNSYGPASSIVLSPTIHKSTFKYTGYGFKVGKERSKYFIWPIVSANITAFVPPDKIGQELAVVSAFQSRKNNRASFVCSFKLFSNEAINNQHDTMIELVKWTFSKKAILKVQGFKYHSEKESWTGNDTNVPKKMFRVLDNLHIQAALSQLDSNVKNESARWIPYRANDVQVEFTMMHPIIRATIEPLDSCNDIPELSKSLGIGCIVDEIADKNSVQLYSAVRTMADRVGLFTLSLRYRRPGWSFLDENHLVAVRQYAHNEYPRLIGASWPYYTAMLSMICGAILLAIVFLYYRKDSKEKEQ